MNAVDKVKEQIRMLGRYDAPDLIPFEVAEKDENYDRTSDGRLTRYIFRLMNVDTQTPRYSFVEVLAEVTEDGIESPDEWEVSEVEPKLKTVRFFQKK